VRLFYMPFYPAVALIVSLSLAATAAGEPTACAPVPPGLVAWWRLEANGADATGVHNGAVFGGSFIAAEVGNGFRPTGVGSLVQVPNSPALNPTNFTIDFWIKLDALTPGNEPCFWKGDAGGAGISSPFGVLVWGTNDTSQGKPFVLIGNGLTFQILDAAVTLSLGTFHHVAATASGTTLAIYVDGALSNTAVQTITPVPSTYPVQIGGLALAQFGSRLEGTIDEVELHNQAATPAQVLAIYEAGPTGKCPLTVPVETTTWGALKVYYRDSGR